MNISVITSILPNGQPYQSQYGLLYPFLVSFDDNTEGTVNTKTAQPPYKVGDRVGYEVTGDFRGVSKLKISKNPDKPFTGASAPQVQPPYQPPQVHQASPETARAASAAISPNVEAINPVFGATVGMAMNQAIQVLTQNLEHDELVERIIRPDFWYSVHEVASDVIRVARELEKGRLAPSPTERSKRSGGLRNAPAGHPDSHPDLEAAIPDPPF